MTCMPEKVACGAWEPGATEQKIGSKLAKNPKIGSIVWECGSQDPALFSGMALRN